MGFKEMKAIERRKELRKLMRQGLSQMEIAERLEVDYSTISEDIQIIKRENIQAIVANKQLIEKDVTALLQQLQIYNDINDECWKIYYGKEIIKDKLGNKLGEKDLDPQTKLIALDKIRQNSKDQAQLLKLLNPTQVTVEKMVYIEQMTTNYIDNVINTVMEYVPKDKQIELLNKIKAINIERTEEK